MLRPRCSLLHEVSSQLVHGVAVDAVVEHDPVDRACSRASIQRFGRPGSEESQMHG